MTVNTTEQDHESAVANYGQWLNKAAILSEKVDGRWRHQLVTGDPAWQTYLASIEARATAVPA